MELGPALLEVNKNFEIKSFNMFFTNQQSFKIFFGHVCCVFHFHNLTGMPQFVIFMVFLFDAVDVCLFSDFLMLLLKVHITQGDYEGNAVLVSWTTPDEPGSSTVLYWAENSKTKSHAKGIVLTYKYFNYTSGYIHHCTIKNLTVCADCHLTALIYFHMINLIS